MRIIDLQPTPTCAEPVEIPAQLMDSVMRHQANLAALVASLQAAGFDEDTVNSSIRSLIDSYAEELMAAIQTLVKGLHHD